MQKEPTKPGYAIWLSALIFPGVGQFFQNRRLAGSLFVLGFSVALGVAGRVIFQVMRNYYALGFQFNDPAPEDPVPLSRLIGALLASLLIYVANLIDVALAARMQARGR
jgi:hypothetical protein